MLPYLNLGFTSIPMYSFMVLLGMLAFVITTIYIIEKKENKEKNITNRILIISMLGFVVLVFFAYVFNSIFHLGWNLLVGRRDWRFSHYGCFDSQILSASKG